MKQELGFLHTTGNNLPEVSNVTVLLVINLREVVYRLCHSRECGNPLR